MNKKDETFLGKWLNGDLTPEEERLFKNSKEEVEYRKILAVADLLETPEFDSDELVSKIEKETINKVKPKVRKLNIVRTISIAASIAVLFGVIFFQNSKNTAFSTNFGEQLAVYLPDSSKVVLNANSKIEFNTKSWSKNRAVNLNGEAYFIVKKGSNFKVETGNGMVQVLGTEFNVNSSPDYFEVQCYSGKVKVTNKVKSETLLTKGRSVRSIKDINEEITFNPEDAFWLNGISSFNKAPLYRVILALENQFNIKIENSEGYRHERFTGNFKNDDRKIALETVLSAMNIEYSISENTVILIKK